jgi:polar amino acid transport system permease protein
MTSAGGNSPEGEGRGGPSSRIGVGERQWQGASRPTDATSWALTALGVAGLAVACAWGTLKGVRGALATLQQGGLLADGLMLLFGLIATTLMLPALRSLQIAGRAKTALAAGDLIAARVAGAAARSLAWYSFGFAGALVLILIVIQFFIANDLAVSRTFFMLPLIANTFILVLKAFWTNVYIFVIAEVLVLVWGLVIAMARLAPGPAGLPIRVMATFYADVFRGLPAIINIYLIGFGIPLTGLPILQNLSQESFAILALTLTYGAYVAEVYRSGIESIHWSQTAAARSLGLSYMQTMRYVIVPQAVRRIIPPLLNDFIGLQKDTALVNVIGTIDAFNQAKIIASNHFNLSPVTTVAILFVIITIPQARLVDKMMERDQRRMRAGGS